MNRTLTILLGLLFWLAVGWLGGASAWRVYECAAVETTAVTLAPLNPGPEQTTPSPGQDVSGLAPGDAVFVLDPAGLRRVGEVGAVDVTAGRVIVQLHPAAAASLNASTRATCWRTPLDAEHALTALFPDDVQARIAQRWQEAWTAHQEDLVAAWKPIAADLMRGYLELIVDDLERSLSAHEGELKQIGRVHADAFMAEWPAIQARLSPILQQHLTPVLGELMDDAVDDAPKARIAWSLARGRTTVAYEQMLDWLSEYLANMPEADRQRLREALRRSWDAALADEALVEHFRKLGRQVRDDPEVSRVLLDIYRDAISQNPKTAEFVRSQVLESPRVREETYLWIERFAPTVKSVLAEALFDERGVTRPEVVHLLRSIALDRSVAWITLDTPDGGAPPLRPADELPLLFLPITSGQ